MISNIPIAVCEEQNLFYTPRIPLQITYMPNLKTPNRNEYIFQTNENGICTTSHGIYVLLNMDDFRKNICIWLNSNGSIIKRKYEI